MRTARSGRRHHSLQARRSGRNETRHAPASRLDAAMESAENCRRFMELAQRCVELCESRFEL